MNELGPQRGPASIGQIQAQTTMANRTLSELANTKFVLHNLSVKLLKMNTIALPTAEHWEVIHEARSALGLDVPPQSSFSMQRRLIWEELRKQAREEICTHFQIGQTVNFRNKEQRITSITPTFKVVLEHGGKKIVASPLGLLPPEISRDYSYMTGDTW